MELNLHLHSFGLCVGETDLSQSRDVEVATSEVFHTTNGRTGRSLALPSQSLKWSMSGTAHAVGTCPLCACPQRVLTHAMPRSTFQPTSCGDKEWCIQMSRSF